VLKVVAGRNSRFVHMEYTAITELFNREDVSDVIFPVVADSYRFGRDENFKYIYAGYKLAREGKRIELPVSIEMKLKLAKLLWRLHSNNCIHGDPRVRNVLELDDSLNSIFYFFVHHVLFMLIECPRFHVRTTFLHEICTRMYRICSEPMFEQKN
jgi:hypothetical protein